MATRNHRCHEICGSVAAVVWEPGPRQRFAQRWSTRMRRLERQGGVRAAVLRDLARMVRRVQ